MRGISGRIHSSSMVFLAAAAFWCSTAQAQILAHFDLPAQPLARSLKAIGTATNTDVGFNSSQVAGFIAPSLKADLTVDAALMRVLVGTGLRPQHLDDHTIVIAATESSTADSAAIRLLPVNAAAPAEVYDQAVMPQAEAGDDSTGNPSSLNSRQKELEEIVVTGTHIRGLASSASPTHTYTRDDIDRSGVGNVQEFIRRLPQNFGGGVSDGTVGSIAGGGTDISNSSNGTAVNLRGLGSNSSLVLVNGRRVAAADTGGNYVDISMIPLAAIDRIEVVPDGSSAVYGSDAVGGVMNFILRHDFDGVETRARFGSVTQGSSHEIEVGQTMGREWDGGSALVSYEYLDRSPLFSRDRDYSQSTVKPFSVMLLPRQLRHAVFLTANQTVGPNVELFSDGSYSHRSSSEDFLNPIFGQRQPATAEAYGVTLGGRIRPSSTLEFELSSSFGRSETHYSAIDSVGNSGLVGDLHTTSGLFSIDPKVDGSLWSLPAGSILFALGGQYREEPLDSEDLLAKTSNHPRRRVTAGYLEFHVPLVEGPTSMSSTSRLEMSLAARYEHYSDFGSTTNPKVGLIWRPFEDVKVRSTYGTSFRAPTLSDMDAAGLQVVPFPLPDPLTGNTTNVMFLIGNNANLQPEKARTWTFGADLQPATIPGVKINATYYDVHFTQRIVNPFQYVGFFDALNEASILGQAIVQRHVPTTIIRQWAGAPHFQNPFNIDPATISTLADYRKRNLSVLDTNGVDLGLAYETTSRLGRFEVGFDGTYIFKFDTKFAAAQTASILNTPYNPVDLKLRARGIVSRGGLTAALFINYTDSYTDGRGGTGSAVPVKSWTTGDVNITYNFREGHGALRNAAATLSVINITNAAPPFVAARFAGAAWGAIQYDGANASPLGRFVAIQVSERW